MKKFFNINWAFWYSIDQEKTELFAAAGKRLKQNS